MSHWFRLAGVLAVLFAHVFCTRNELPHLGIAASAIAATAAWWIMPPWHVKNGFPWAFVTGLALGHGAFRLDQGLFAMVAAFAWLFAGPEPDPRADSIPQSGS